jgi:hypothetical protein
MNKLILAGIAIAGVAIAVKRLAPKLPEVDIGRAIAAMPDNAPPKWIFTNVTAIRENTERILEILEGRAALADAPPNQPSTEAPPGG